MGPLWTSGCSKGSLANCGLLKRGSCELRVRHEKGVFKAAHPHTPFLGQCPPPPPREQTRSPINNTPQIALRVGEELLRNEGSISLYPFLKNWPGYRKNSSSCANFLNLAIFGVLKCMYCYIYRGGGVSLHLGPLHHAWLQTWIKKGTFIIVRWDIRISPLRYGNMNTAMLDMQKRVCK